MSDLNICTFSGRLTEDPREFTANGDVACRIAVASPRVYQDNEKTAFFPCSIFGPTAGNVIKYLHKGSHVSVMARFETDTYTDKTSGETKKGYGFVVQEINFLDP